MKYSIMNIMIVVFTLVFFGCDVNDTSDPEKEPAKNIIGLVSEGADNIVAEVHNLTGADADGWTDGYIVARISGTVDVTNPITFSLVQDPALLDAYNKTNYGTDTYRFAKLLSTDRYIIENPFSFTNPEKNREMQVKVRIKAVGLSPDFSYFIPIRIGSSSAYEYDLKKNTLLYQLYFENRWASTKAIPKYRHNGKRLVMAEFVDIGNEVSSSLDKEVFPISGNEVRILAGTKTISANDNRESVYEKWAILLSIAADGKVSITPYGNSAEAMNLEQVDDDPLNPNLYKLVVYEESVITYKTFLLNYKYYDPDAKVWYWIKEQLQVEQVQ